MSDNSAAKRSAIWARRCYALELELEYWRAIARKGQRFLEIQDRSYRAADVPEPPSISELRDVLDDARGAGLTWEEKAT